MDLPQNVELLIFQHRLKRARKLLTKLELDCSDRTPTSYYEQKHHISWFKNFVYGGIETKYYDLLYEML